MLRRHRQHAVLGAALLTLAALVPTAVASTASGSTSSAATDCRTLAPFHASAFHHPTKIDNRYLPMTPGTQRVYKGTTSAGSHQVVFTITDLVKVVDGVTARVVHDVDIQDGQVAEAELAFFAQDDKGNVWNVGEYPETFENGKFAGAPDVWLAGRRNAEAGIHMAAHPEKIKGVRYLQGRAPAIDFLDCAQVVKLDGRVSVPAGRFSHVLTTHETSPLEKTKAIQTKEHAPGVGIVRIGAINDPEGETLVLTRYAHLSSGERARLNRAAIALDAHGHSGSVSPLYKNSPRVRYGG
jgi:hypothetical protein